MQTNNPFASAGTIVNGDLFVGRSVELTEVYNRVLGKNFGNLSIVGIPKIGKSSLMQALYDRRNELYDNNKYVVVWYTFKAIEEYGFSKYHRKSYNIKNLKSETGNPQSDSARQNILIYGL